ncbi:probable glutamate receptor [Eriocheir sinensis]|uniref:probable glutamate receptor n=1 Tax=Eriocheir sinensis TaxID=95602 RepID=UPI0021C64857|nr:probable glutamate receptor [Eriocheir sinensis]
MHRHRLRVVAKELFPYVCYNLPSSSSSSSSSFSSPSSSGPLIPCDSLDFRILDTAASLLNFTYEVWAPRDDKWGALVLGGSWNGIVGELLRGEADLSLRLFWSADRKMAIDFTRAYIFEPFVMVTRQPGPLQQSLAPVRPFTGEVWAVLLGVTSAAGVALWAVQGAGSRLRGGDGRGLGLGTSLLTAWGMLLADMPTTLPTSLPVRVTAGWWWVGVVVLTAMYRGSLIAHLTAPGNTAPLNTLAQLRGVRGATWGLEGGYGVGWDWFKFNINPDVRKMFEAMQVTPRDEQLARVLSGPHAFFTWKYYIQTVLAGHYTDAAGHHPFHIGSEELLMGQSGWGVRKSAPFLAPLDRVIGRLVEVGLIDHWLKDLFPPTQTKTKIKATATDQQEEEEEEEEDADEATRSSDESALQVLGLHHLQGAFYLLLVGGGGALVAFVAEHAIGTPPGGSSARDRRARQWRR